MTERYILSGIYVLRALAIVAFMTLPLTAGSVYVLASAMGVLWLSTEPATNAVVAQICGVRHSSMLGGFVLAPWAAALSTFALTRIRSPRDTTPASRSVPLGCHNLPVFDSWRGR